MTLRACRVCGCTEISACVTEAGPCWWVEGDLCSACAPAAPPPTTEGRVLHAMGRGVWTVEVLRRLLPDYSAHAIDKALRRLRDKGRVRARGGGRHAQPGHKAVEWKAVVDAAGREGQSLTP